MNWRSESGYTLLEMLVVLGIAGVTLAIVTPRLPRAGAAVSVESVAKKLIEDLAKARERALAERRPIEVGDTGPAIWRPAQKAGAPGRSQLTMFPDGTVSAGQLEITSGGHRILVVSRPWSGRFEIERADAKQ